MKCLLEELTQIQNELERTLLGYLRQLQIYALKGIDNHTSIPISNHIFKNYYKDTVLSLNKNQGISLQLIHAYVDIVNSGIIEHEKLTKSLQNKNVSDGQLSITEKDIELWGKSVICQFKNVAIAIYGTPQCQDHNFRNLR